MAEREKRRATTFRTSRGAIVNVSYPDIYIAPSIAPADVTSPAEMREALREELQNWIRVLEFKPFAKHPNNPVLPFGAAGAWDELDVEGPDCVFRNEDNRFWMYYHGQGTGVNHQVGLAYSSDLVSWTKEATNPVLRLGATGAWDERVVAAAQVLKVGNTFHMWYGGMRGKEGGIGHATSPNGVSWTKDPNNPVFTLPGKPLVWPDDVLVVNDKYWLYFGYEVDGKEYLITSSDGVAWSLYGVVLEHGKFSSFDGKGVLTLKTLRLGNLWLGFYTGFDLTYRHHIGMCFSLDGKHWAKYPQAVLSRNANAWDNSAVVFNAPLLYDEKLYLFYGGDTGPPDFECQIGLAETKIGEAAETDFFRDSTGAWHDRALSGGEYTYGVPTFGYDEVVISFFSNTAGVLTIEVLEPDWGWRTYDTVSVSANVLTSYALTAHQLGVRISFNNPATVSGWYTKR